MVQPRTRVGRNSSNASIAGCSVSAWERSPISIEEPELTVHPGALAVLADVLNEASESSQIVVTTHSPDLIDRVTNSRHVEILRVVELINDYTTVNEVPKSQVEAVKQYLLSPGELHRMGELVISARS